MRFFDDKNKKTYFEDQNYWKIRWILQSIVASPLTQSQTERGRKQSQGLNVCPLWYVDAPRDSYKKTIIIVITRGGIWNLCFEALSFVYIHYQINKLVLNERKLCLLFVPLIFIQKFKFSNTIDQIDSM